MSSRIYDIIIGMRGNSLTSLAAIVVYVILFAAPGMFLAVNSGADLLGVLVGVLFFVFAYWVPLQFEEVQAFVRRRDVRKAIRISLWTLFATYVAFPVGVVITIVLGSIATSWAGIKTTDDDLAHFSNVNAARIVAATVIYGSLLHLLLGLYASLVLIVIRWTNTAPNDDTLCQVCGYDVRASPIRCPECGNPVPFDRGLNGNVRG